MADHLLSFLDWIQGRLWSAGIRFQWPCWLLDWAWDRCAAPHDPECRDDDCEICKDRTGPLVDWEPVPRNVEKAARAQLEGSDA